MYEETKIIFVVLLLFVYLEEKQKNLQSKKLELNRHLREEKEEEFFIFIRYYIKCLRNMK